MVGVDVCGRLVQFLLFVIFIFDFFFNFTSVDIFALLTGALIFIGALSH